MKYLIKNVVTDSFEYKSLQEYKNNYFDVLEYYKKLHIDNDEMNFIEYEIRLINDLIRPVIESQKTEIEETGEMDLGKWIIELNLSSYKKIILFLETRKSEIEAGSNNVFSKITLSEDLDLSNTQTIENNITIINEPSGEIFSNNGFELFEHILNEYVKPRNTKGRYEDLSYFYRCLFDDRFIHKGPEYFKIWFIEKYEEEFSKIKTKVQSTNSQRKKDYKTALDWFKSKN